MSDHLVFIGKRKRTEKTAMAEAVRVVEDWWLRIGHPRKVVALSAERRLVNGRNGGWHVRIQEYDSTTAGARR